MLSLASFEGIMVHADGVIVDANQRLSELLGRRSTKALPVASLGRAALADLSGDLRSLQAMCSDCDAKLALLGR